MKHEQREELKEILEKQKETNTKLDEIKSGNPFFKWRTVKETCALLKVSPRTLQTYRDESKIGFSQIGSKIYFRLTDIEAFLDQHYVTAIK